MNDLKSMAIDSILEIIDPYDYQDSQGEPLNRTEFIDHIKNNPFEWLYNLSENIKELEKNI